MLSHQRELQLKKRNSAVQSGKFIFYSLAYLLLMVGVSGMVRSSLEVTAGVNPMKKSGDGQFTPAMRQFSAPKAVRDPYSEFPVPK